MSPKRPPGYKQRMVERRDEITQNVATNLNEVLAELGMSKSELRKKIGSETSSAIYDFLGGRSRSIKVETLARFAVGLDVPLVLFLVEPGKRRAMHALFRSLDRLESDEINRLSALARTLFEPQGD